MATNLSHGFAALDGGTSGGAGGKTVTVSTGAALQAAINGTGSGTEPLTIVVHGTITAANTGADEITLSNRHNITILGDGTGGELDGIGLHVLGGSSNLIIQNLKIHHVHAGPADGIGIEGGSHNIWVDHNELYDTLTADKDYYDGLLDIKRGAHNITVSNNYFHDHHKVSLVGYADTDENAWNVTYDHNVFSNVGSRLPSIRFGDAHIYNNTFTNVEVSGVNVRMGAVARIEGNVFEHVANPVASLDSAKVGYWDLRGNILSDVTWSSPGSGEAVAGPAMTSTTTYTPPYAYTLTPVAQVKGYDLVHAGVGKLGLADDSGMTPGGEAGGTTDGTTGGTSGGSTGSTPGGPPGGGTGGTTGGGTGTGGSGTAGQHLTGTGSADTLNGAAGSDVITAGGGKDVLNGMAGADELHGGGGNDTVSGGDGNDRLYGEDANDSLKGDAGNDTLDGGIGSDGLDGGAGSDSLLGGDSNDTLLGGEGDDVLNGGTGKDILVGGLGRDVLTGGAGNDILRLLSAGDSPAGSGRDVIADFAHGDRLDLSAIDADTTAAGNQAFSFIGSSAFAGHAGELHLVAQGGAVLVEADLNGDRTADLQVELTGAYKPVVGDFIL